VITDGRGLRKSCPAISRLVAPVAAAAAPEPFAVQQMGTPPLQRPTAQGVESYGSRVMLFRF
jgi:hypothetical protein